MDERKVLIGMVKTLLGDIQNIQQRGAGYYAPSHFIEKYNVLLGKAKEVLGGQSALIDTLQEIPPLESVDPSEKMKAVQKVIIESGQLISLLNACVDEESSGGK